MVEAKCCSTVERVRPIDPDVNDVLAPFSVGEASSSRDGEGVPGQIAEEVREFRDEDGAVYFDSPGESPKMPVRIAPEVPKPSAEMVRRHKASGHCPYRPWCPECVAGACTAPAHRRREQAPVGNIPELHSDYGFFETQKEKRAGQ